MHKFIKIGSICGVALAAASMPALAADNISGDVGFNTNSHFVSYGADVWGAGDGFYGPRMTNSIYGDLAIKITSDFSYALNVWTDLNSNVPSGIGGSIQEVDINNTISYNLGHGFSTSATYGAWSYAGDVEEVVDLALGFDDTGTIFDGFAFNPKIVWHDRISGNSGQKIGSAFVLSVGPSFPVWGDFSISIPAGVAIFTTHDFQGGTKAGDGGVGYGYLGASLSTPLSFIPPAYGAWSANFDLVEYFTDKSYIPGNPQSDFLTGSFNIKLGF